MAELRKTDEFHWPPHLDTYDPEQWDSEHQWRQARVKEARALGFPVLPEIRALVQLSKETLE
jgi:hypothetical protein